MVVQGSTSAAATSVTIPAHQSGDIIVIFARGTAAAPTVPTAGGTVPTFVTQQTGFANAIGLVTATAIANASNHTSGTWTNATHLIAIVIRAASGNVISVGASSTNSGNNTLTLPFPALTLQTADGSSLVLRGGTRVTAATEMSTPPSGYTNVVTQPVAPNSVLTSHSRLNVAANPTLDTVNLTGSNAAFRTHSLEIKEVMGLLNPSDSTVPTDQADFQMSYGLSVADSSAPTDALGVSEDMTFSDSATISDSFDGDPEHAPCSAIVNTFKVGQMVVGRLASCHAEPVMHLVGKPYGVSVTAVDETRILFAKAILRLKPKAYALATVQTVTLGKSTLRLVGKPVLIPLPVTVTFGKPVLRMKGKSYTLRTSQILAIGKPRLLLRGGAIRRVGQPGLIPSVPESLVLTPSACQPVVLTPAPCEDGGVLVPTAVKVV